MALASQQLKICNLPKAGNNSQQNTTFYNKINGITLSTVLEIK
jgi:hypothetical protein